MRILREMTFAELTRELAPTPAGYLKAARAIEAGGVEGLRPLRVAVLSTFTAQFLAPYLVVEGARRGLAIAPWFAPWGQLEQQALDAASELYAQEPDAIVVLARLEELEPSFTGRFLRLSEGDRIAKQDGLAARLRSLVEALRKRSAAPVFLANFPPPNALAAGLADPSVAPGSQSELVQQCNAQLARVASAHPDCLVFDLARVAATHGLRAWTDPKLFALARTPFSVSAQIAIGAALARTIRAAFVPPAKVLVLDLDNTLWGGVLGEDGLGGIALGDEYPGNVFKAFQNYLLTLKDRGVLLAIATKNNEADVEELFAKHRDCVLARGDFAAARINWREKSANIRELAEELNVGLEAFAFFDDNAFEREEVRRHLPMVRVLDAPESPLGFIDAIEESGAFDRLTVSAEDRQRGDFYQHQAARAAALEASESTEDFLRSLEMVATIGDVNAATLPRVAQLLAKTNQFNLTTRRHSAGGIAAMIDRGAIALWVRLADRFGDSGLVSVGIAVEEQGNNWRIDTLLLSCRVIGRAAETLLLSELARRVAERGGCLLVGEYLPTAKNALAADFYPKHGFAPIGGGCWQLDLATQRVTPPPFIQLHST